MPQANNLQQVVALELSRDPSMVSNHISVATNGGVVTLSGYVATLAEKHAAEAAAARVKGVKAVVCELEVHISAEARKTDEELAAAAIERLSWNAIVPKDPADVRKAVLEEKLPLDAEPIRALRERLFGRWEANWAGYNDATSVALPGTPTQPQFHFLMYPTVTLAGKAMSCLDAKARLASALVV